MALEFPITSEELIDSTRSDSHRVVVWVVCTSSTAMAIQLLVVCGRFLHFKFATSHSSLFQVLVSYLMSHLAKNSCVRVWFTLFTPKYVEEYFGPMEVDCYKEDTHLVIQVYFPMLDPYCLVRLFRTYRM